MKIFSVYDNINHKEQVIKEGEFSTVLFANVNYHKPMEDSGIHSHSDHEEIFICFQGKGRVIIDQGETSISRGDVLIFEPGESYGFESDEVDPLAYLSISVRTI
jgi:mannose-6-phosphate isomerase-like protein (cupin superfamily)